jgi:cytosine permease
MGTVRQWWILLVWLFGVVFYATNVINYLGTFLAIAGVPTNTWLLVILVDYFVCRGWLRLGRTEGIAVREAEVRAWNPCGLLSLGVTVAVGALGIIVVYPTYYASFLAMVIGTLLPVASTAATKGRYYRSARASAKHGGDR